MNDNIIVLAALPFGISEAGGIAIIIAIFVIIASVRIYRQTRAVKRTRASEEKALDDHHRVRWSARKSTFGRRPVDWAMAVAAPFAICRGAKQDELAFPSAADERAMLSSAWGVADRASMIETLYTLLVDGHRTGYQFEVEYWTSLSPQEATEYEKVLRDTAGVTGPGAERLWRFRRVRANDRGIQQLDFLAWDMVRFAMLVRAGLTAGYLSGAEAEDLLLMPAAQLQSSYSSWEELGESFRLGRWYWNSQGGKGESETDAHDINRQKALMGANSPWRAVTWRTAVPQSRLLLADALVDEGVLDPYELDEGELSAHNADSWARVITAAIRERHTDEDS